MPPDASAPIASWHEPDNWARLPIAECGDPLVPAPTGLRVRPLYYECGIPGATPNILVRAGVAERLVAAARVLAGQGATLVLFDGYRPLAVQQSLWDSREAVVRRDLPGLTDVEVAAEVRHFVATPNANPACPPPHRTGGAVDVYLIDSATGAELPMGTEVDEGIPAAATLIFEGASEGDHLAFREHRRLLYHAMIGAGFTNYYNEWWHFDYGNQRWANVAAESAAVYGIPPDENK